MFGSSNGAAGAAAAAAAAFEGASDEEDEEQRYQQQWGDAEVHTGDEGEDAMKLAVKLQMGWGRQQHGRTASRSAWRHFSRPAALTWQGLCMTRPPRQHLRGWGLAAASQQQQQQQIDDQDDEEEEADDFFTLKVPGGASAAAAAAAGGSRRQQQQQHQQQQEGPAAVLLQSVDAFDSSRPFAAAAAAIPLGSSSSSSVPQGPGFSVLDLDARWSSPEAVQGLRNRFVTGDWDAAAARAKALPGEDSEDDGEAEEGDVFGDFEDVEEGLTFTGDDAITAAAQKAIKDATAEELRAKKLAKRAAWDAGYAQGGGTAAAAAAAAVDRGVDPAAAAGGSDDEDDGEDDAAAAGRPKNPNRRTEAEGESFYDATKREMAARAAATSAALSQLDPRTRLALAGHGVGSYVRLRLTGVPYELVTHWDPHRPLLVGGLGQGEQRMGVMRLRFKRHRWYPKTLKTRDPLVVSVGWRRFQSIPVYALEDHNRRLRALKYTPQHCHCLAALYGPLAPPNTGVVAIQASAAGPTPPASWRIAATAVVLEQEAELRIVKKLKLVGTPLKVHKHSAFVGGLFNSQLEASRFEGASVQTVSGIRGTVKKALRAGVSGVRDGGVRVTFEDKPLLSDLVFLRAWVAVDVPQLHNTMTNLLAPAAAPANAAAVSRKGHNRQQQQDDDNAIAADSSRAAAAAAAPAAAATAAAAGDGGGEFSPAAAFSGARSGCVFKKGPQGLGYYRDVNPKGLNPAAAAPAGSGSLNPDAGLNPAGGAAAAAGPGGWVGMRTVAELRREAGVGAPRQPDSLYKRIERAPRVFNPLKVPAKLQAALPFKTKPKVEAPRKRKTLEQKRAVVLDKDEKKAATLLQQLNAIRNAKAEKRHQQSARRREQYAKKVAKEAEWRDKHSKDERKQRHIAAGKAAKRAAMASEGGGGKFAAMAAKKQRRQDRE
ncbi:hypothetical protein COO60DRAFT_73335 [Scenedesmus sp. NREL 46B-D3]|nr:hypothetical protein COO60DRAFT_73335 [Scenedesmus sp. NREL 46B-D3]